MREGSQGSGEAKRDLVAREAAAALRAEHHRIFREASLVASSEEGRRLPSHVTAAGRTNAVTPSGEGHALASCAATFCIRHPRRVEWEGAAWSLPERGSEERTTESQG